MAGLYSSSLACCQQTLILRSRAAASRRMRPQTGLHPSRRGVSAAPPATTAKPLRGDEEQAALLARGRSGRPQPSWPLGFFAQRRKQDGRMTDAKYDVLGIGNAIFDVLVQTDEGFLARHGMTKGGMALIDEARAAAIYKDMGPATEMSGGSGGQHHRRPCQFRRPRGLHRQGQERPDRRSLHPRHPRRRRRLRDQGGGKRPRHRLLLHPGDAGRRAHHEHLSRRGAGPDARGYRRSADRGLPHRLSRRLSLGSRRTPRKPSSRPRASRTAPAARWR